MKNDQTIAPSNHQGHIRFASPEDAGALLDIYANYIDTQISFEYGLPSLEEFTERIRHISETYPYLVYEEDGRLLGYAYAHRLQERPAYQWNAELSIYLAPSSTGKGIGKMLGTAVCRLLKLMQVHTLYSLVTSPNPASEGLHKSLGFQTLAIHKHTGYKNGKWLDVIWFEKQLLPFTDAPDPLTSIHQIDANTVNLILSQPFSAN